MIELENKTLKSNRLEYRLLSEDDKDALMALLSDNSVTIPAGFFPAKSKEEFDEFFNTLTLYSTGIAILLNNQLIGYFHVNRYRINNDEFKDKNCVGIGIVIDKDFQNKGYGKETLICLTNYLLSIFDVCFADCFKDNIASKKMIEKSGYIYFEEYEIHIDGLNEDKICLSYYKKK